MSEMPWPEQMMDVPKESCKHHQASHCTLETPFRGELTLRSRVRLLSLSQLIACDHKSAVSWISLQKLSRTRDENLLSKNSARRLWEVYASIYAATYPKSHPLRPSIGLEQAEKEVVGSHASERLEDHADATLSGILCCHLHS